MIFTLSELNAGDILSERLFWQQQQDPMTHFTQDFVSAKNGLTETDNRLPHKGLQSHYRPHHVLQADHASYSSSCKEQTSVCAPPELTIAGQHDSNVELPSHRIPKLFGDRTALVSTILGMDSVVRDESPPSSAELTELFFDWSDAESNLRLNSLNLWDSYPSPEDSILCPTTPSRGDTMISSDSLINDGFSDWKVVDAVPGFRADESSSIAATPYVSATSSGCGSTDGEDGATGVSTAAAVATEHRFPADGNLFGPSPGAMASATNDAEGGESSASDIFFPRKNGFLRDFYSPTEEVDDWMEAFVDSNNFHSSTHFAGYGSPSNGLTILSFPRDSI